MRRVLLILSFLLSACFTPGEHLDKVIGSIQSTCLKPQGDPVAKYPWEATYPLTTAQHVFCQHMVTETTMSSWPSGVGVCSGEPGLFQVDVWVRQLSNSNPDWRCARVNVPTNGTITYWLAWEPLMEMGWLASNPVRYIEWFEMGRGTTAVVSYLYDVHASGCTPSSACHGWVVPQSGSPTWVQTDTTFMPSSLHFGPTL